MTAQFDNRASFGPTASRIGIDETADTFAEGDDLFARIAMQMASRRIA